MEKKELLAMALAELRRRTKTPFVLENFCFKEQLDFIRDPAPFKTAVCSRRAGKTISCAADLVNTAISNPKRVCIYITLTATNAKRIIWRELLEINRKFNLKGHVSETDLSIKFPNDSIIYCSGANDRSSIEKFRGLAIALCYIDECQSFPAYIQNLVDEVISKALFDYNGTLCLIGTPGPVPSGYFYDCVQSENWSHHSWTMFQNPHIQKNSGKTPQELLERELKRKGIGINDPTIQREVFAKWTTDLDALVFKYDRIRNHFGSLPLNRDGWEYVIGCDIGFNDSDAIGVIGWHPKDKKAYLAEEYIQDKQGITELAEVLGKFVAKYNPLKVVMDTGGLGKKIAEEMQKRHSLPIHAAEKSRKVEYIELLNDSLRRGEFLAQNTSIFAQDCYLVEWERESTHKQKISDRYHSDITDAVLYAFRESLHWLHEPVVEAPKSGSAAWWKREQEEMEQAAMAALNTSEDGSY